MTSTPAAPSEMEHLDQRGAKAFDGFQILSKYTHLAGRPQGRLAALLDDLLTERQAEQPEPPADPELEALLPF